MQLFLGMVEVWAIGQLGKLGCSHCKKKVLQLKLLWKLSTQINQSTCYSKIYDVLPIKSGTKRPSENLPVGRLKKVSPYGQESAETSTPLRYLLLPASKSESPNTNKALCSASALD